MDSNVTVLACVSVFSILFDATNEVKGFSFSFDAGVRGTLSRDMNASVEKASTGLSSA